MRTRETGDDGAGGRVDNRSGSGAWGGAMVVNAALIASVATAMVVGVSGAQSEGADRRMSGNYTAVGGATTGGHANVVYVMDTANRELVALQWNDSSKQLDGIGYRDLVDDLTRDTDR